jgi:hypothetical protein
MKDDLELKTVDVYSIPCECGKTYIGQTGRSIEARIKEHHRHNQVYHPEKSAVGKHSINLGHRIHFHDTCILGKISGRTERLIRGAPN